MRLLAAVLLFSSLCTAQTSRKPFFPLPARLGDFQSIATLAPELRAAITPALATAPCKLDGSEKYSTAQADLQHEGVVTLIRIDESCLCGPSGNCPIFVIQKNKLVLPDGQGFAFAVSANPKGGTPDLLIASHTSANVTSLQRYQWKGSRFKLHDCQAAIRKDDAKSSTWNPEELDINSCDAIALK
jgi:hypothetical protein